MDRTIEINGEITTSVADMLASQDKFDQVHLREFGVMTLKKAKPLERIKFAKNLELGAMLQGMWSETL
ncbi:MAG: hypothetical protein QNJ29_03305 [Rhizobiaceae bacterium]|nr:hypothetical protein [Rhizobiaceae bacterium]